jgi:hypothetical protein
MSSFQRVSVSPPLCARIPPLQPGLTGSPSHGHTSNEPQLVGAASDDPVSDVATQAGDNSAVRAPAPTTVELDATVAGSSSSAMDSPVPWINSVSAASESAAGALESGVVAAPGTCLCWGRPQGTQALWESISHGRLDFFRIDPVLPAPHLLRTCSTPAPHLHE